MVNIKINGLDVAAEKGMTVFEAAETVGIYIPTLCHHPDLSTFGACRVCMVDADGQIVTACRAPVKEGMVVKTDTKEVNQVRRVAVELIMANHHQDCQSCSQNNRCKLQEVSAFVGVTPERMARMRRCVNDAAVDESNPFFALDRSKCILCGVCIRTCEEINGATALDFGFRGYETSVATLGNKPLLESRCVSCGECVERCPTGALARRDWVLPEREVQTVCSYCGVGCSMYLGVRGDSVVQVRGVKESLANEGHLCVKGRFGFGFIDHPDRLSKPLIRRDGVLEEATWEEALDLVAAKLGEIRETNGPDSLAGLSSARCTTEDNYLFQKLLRSLGTNNVDHCARLWHAPTVAGLATAFGSGAMTNSIGEVEDAGALFIIGSNTTETHPVISYRVSRAKRKGAALIVADPRRIELAEKADVFLQLLPGTNVALLNGLAHVVIRDGLVDKEFIKERTEGFNDVKLALEKYTPAYVSEITGVAAEDIEKAAHLFAKADSAAILYTMGITQHTSGTDSVLAIANLAMMTGNLGKASSGVNPLRGQNNVQGACDMGALPPVITGYQPVADAGVRAKFGEAWGVELSDKPGLTVSEIMDGAYKGSVKGLMVMGENPALSDADINHVHEALKNLEFLVVQDIFLSETAELAHVVLPACSFAEKDGTFVNTERRVQRIRKAVSPRGESCPDWAILTGIARRMGLGWEYASAEEIFEEIRRLTPSYAGISYRRLEEGGIQWPCPTEDHPGTKFLHQGKFSRGLGKFIPVEYGDAAEQPDEEFPFIMTTGRNLYHYHTGTMTRRSSGLNAIRSEELIQLNQDDAGVLGVADGDKVKVSSRRGQVEARVEVTEEVPKGVIFMTFHFKESPANALTNCALDPKAKTPELKVCAVNVEKAV